MTLTLVIGTGERLSNGVPGELILHRRGAVVGRATTCDWPLPDPTRHISARHFEVRYDGRGYTLADCSTNGTLLAATGERLSAPHAIAHGDRFQVGPLTIEACLSGNARVASEPEVPEPVPGWSGWDPQGTPSPAAADGPPQGWGSPPSGVAASPTSGGWDPVSSPGWDAAPGVAPVQHDAPGWAPRTGPSVARPDAHRAASGWDAPAAGSFPSRQAGGWAPDAAATPPPAPISSAWDSGTPVPDPASAWSSAASDRPAASSPEDLWGRIADGNVVDWARGGFGQPIEPARDPLGLSPAQGRASLPLESPAVPAPAPTPAPTAPAGLDRFLTAAGLDAAAIVGDQAAVAQRAGDLFRHLVAGLVVMVEARARAKAQLGADATAYSPAGHNPLKFARTPEEAVAGLLGPSRPGFMSAEAAVEDAFRDLQQHQIATLKAMQGALRATLERFSPSAIRARADAHGLLERIVPTARDAALWQAYEREFGGVALGSDEAFLDVFAKQFRQAYNEQMLPHR